MAKQGKCDDCQIRWIWEREVKLYNVTCPNCKGCLKQTMHFSRYPVHLHPYPAGYRSYAYQERGDALRTKLRAEGREYILNSGHDRERI